MGRDTNIIIFLIAAVVAIILVIYGIKNINTVNPQEQLMKCIAEKSFIYSSSICTHCKEQKDILGDYYKYFNEVDCFKTPQKCIDDNIDATPTWVINKKRYVGVKTLKELKDLSGCQCDPTLLGNSTANQGACTTQSEACTKYTDGGCLNNTNATILDNTKIIKTNITDYSQNSTNKTK